MKKIILAILCATALVGCKTGIGFSASATVGGKDYTVVGTTNASGQQVIDAGQGSNTVSVTLPK